MKSIRAIHPFGPKVGKWTVHGTVADTIKREQQRLEREAKEREVNAAEAAAKVSRIGGGK